MTELINYINGLPGYKISDTHFRLGSKIHIAHFYYAKRFFQNSFYASRLAFLIVKEILADHIDKIKEFKKHGLTLIGYGLYSELLISLVEILIKKKLNIKNINHDLISDADEPSFIKNYNDENRYIIIIVPIGSTFSTAIKIKEFLTEKRPKKEILDPYINVLHVSHFPDDENEKPDDCGLHEIERNFGWTKKEGKTIWIKELITGLEDESNNEGISNNSTKTTKQKYLLSLKSEWLDVKNCRLCSLNEEASKEKPLYFTDKSSVTPSLVFGMPKAREIKESKKFNLTPKSLKYGHLRRDEKHFHFYIEIEEFFKDNLSEISDWLKEIKAEEEFNKTFNETTKVIIVAPGEYTNAGFVNLVNEKLFSNAANIIHFDTKNDQVSNFELLYGKELKENKILYVDDTITTGSTFRNINFFLENTIKKSNEETFDACFILLDRSNYYINRQVKGKIKNYYSFANLHLPSIKDYSGQCPLDIGYARYNDLVENSFLSRMKIHFSFQKDKLLERLINDVKLRDNEKEKYVFQVESIHRIYEWCRIFNKQFDDSFYIWKTSLFDNTDSPFTKTKLNVNSNDLKDLSEGTVTILKVLTHSPFIHYKPIKDKLFQWVLDILKNQVRKIIDEIKNDNFGYNSFRDLKFLIRRAGLLNINYLISKEILSFMATLYGNNGLYKLKKDYQSKTKPNLQDKLTFGQEEMQFGEKEIINVYQFKKVCDFHVFYTAQIKELLYLNEARSIHLEKMIVELKSNESFYSKSSKSFKQLLRWIQEENGILIMNFWNLLQKRFENVEFADLDRDNGLIKYLKHINVKEHYKAKSLNEFLRLSNSRIKYLHDNTLFINFLKLMYFFENDKKASKDPLKFKTCYFMECLKEMISNNQNEEDNGAHKRIGAFFLVKYKQDANAFVAYNIGDTGALDESTLIQNDELSNFLNPSKKNDLSITIIEYHKKNHEWINLYAIDENENQTTQMDFIPEDYNRLLLIRFNKLEIEKENPENPKEFAKRLIDKGQAIAGFYFYNTEEIITDITITRYLLLLRSPICDFIERHHENDEFRDWVDADKIGKLAILYGHGREMLLKISEKEKNRIFYRDIVLNLEHIQTIIALGNNIYTITGDNDIMARFNKFYNVGGSKEIGTEYILRLGEMAKQIYEFEEIENPVCCKIKVVCEKDLVFAFHKSLLDMICFELLINAKKNRWHFSANEGSSSFENVFFTEINSVEKINENIETDVKNTKCNCVEIDASLSNTRLILKISNTGPDASEAITTLKRGQNPKGNEMVAGLKLIRELLKRAEFGQLGEIEFTQKELIKNIGLNKFTVELSLNAMSNVQK